MPRVQKIVSIQLFYKKKKKVLDIKKERYSPFVMWQRAVMHMGVHFMRFLEIEFI